MVELNVNLPSKIKPLETVREEEKEEGADFKLRKSHVNCHENTKGSALRSAPPPLIPSLFDNDSPEYQVLELIPKGTYDLKMREFKEIPCNGPSLA